MIYNSQVILCKNIEIDRSYKNVLTYSESQMLALCQANQVYSNSTYEFLKQDESPMYVNCNYNVAIQCNYIAFQNPNYSNKWFFAFIDSVEYNSTDSVMIHFTIDVFATWFDYWSKLPCYVIREHTNDDTIGANTIDENLNVGEVIAQDEFTINELSLEPYICVMTTYDLSDDKSYDKITKYNNNVFGYLIDCFPLFDATDDLEYYLRKVNQKSHIDDIRDMFIAPQQIFKSPQGVSQLKTINDSLGDEPFTYYRVRSDMTQASTVYNQEIVLNKLHSFNTYANVKNNKLFTYPYNYLYVTNSIGDSNVYKYEDFDYPDNQLAFNLQMTLSIGISGRVIPVSYRGILQNYDEGVALAKFPTCSWSADSFTNWLTREAVNIVPEIAKTGAEFVTGNVGAGVSSIAGMIGSFYKASIMPDKTGGQATGDVNFSAIKNNIKFERMHAKPEFLAQIDDYFSRYGYKTLRVKTANITGRQNWNFVQIGSDEIIGASNNHNNIPVPTTAMEKINDIFKNGVTCWHNHANIGNFGLNNPIA